MGVLVFSNATYGVTLQGGYVYARIYEDTTPDPGDHYFDSVTSLAADHNGANPPTTITHNADMVNGDELTLVIVPEPGTLGLLAVALAGLVCRGRRPCVP